MRKFMVAAGAAALLAASSLSAFADEANGTIQSIDATAGTVTLADGSTYVLPSATDAASLQVGQDVTITFDKGADGKMMATDVAPKS